MENKKKGLILSLLAVLTVILITEGVTYAFFNYAKEGTKDNVITTGSITFLYTEVDGVGNGIEIENAFPISDEVGKKLSKTNEYFDFKITSDTTSSMAIPYEVTARKSSTSDDIDEYIRVYLTKGTTNEEVLLDNYSNLTQTSKIDASKYTEKTIYKGEVSEGSTDYEETFRLRMWIAEDTRFDSTQMNNKTFTLTVNVYANARVVTEEEIAYESNTNITTLLVDDTELTKVENEDYDYETTLPEGTTSTTIEVETINPNATVEVEKIDSLASSNNVKRLSTSKQLELSKGDNYFKVTVTSENKKVIDEYKVNIIVEKNSDNTLKSLSLSNCPLNETFNSNTTSYTCTIEGDVTSTTVSADANNSLAKVEGTGNKDLVEGENIVTIKVTSESGIEKTYTVTVTLPKQVLTLKQAILNKYTTIYTNPTLTTSSNNTTDASGLYKSTLTNSGNPTYYFRGNVENYIDFAGFTWRVVRINEDGTIRIVMQDGLNDNAKYKFSPSSGNGYNYMYYSKSNVESGTMYRLEDWYQTNIVDKDYDSNVATGKYFCEEAKVKYLSSYKSGNATMKVYNDSTYTPTFSCSEDGNTKGIVNTSIGLLTYDEVVYAGAYYNKENSSYYLHIGTSFWTMSPAGVNSYNHSANVWMVSESGAIDNGAVSSFRSWRPVLNLKADTAVTGTGDSSNHWVVAN